MPKPAIAGRDSYVPRLRRAGQAVAAAVGSVPGRGRVVAGYDKDGYR
jgi:hypothetical protein